MLIKIIVNATVFTFSSLRVRSTVLSMILCSFLRLWAFTTNLHSSYVPQHLKFNAQIMPLSFWNVKSTLWVGKDNDIAVATPVYLHHVYYTCEMCTCMNDYLNIHGHNSYCMILDFMILMRIQTFKTGFHNT